MKNLTDFRKTLEAGVDPRLLLISMRFIEFDLVEERSAKKYIQIR